MFPTTVWTTIRQAGEKDRGAQEEFALRYRAPVLEFVRARGFRDGDADDICQDAFLRVLERGVLAKADRERGRFRSLIRTVVLHTIHDQLRKRRETPSDVLDPEDHRREFDRNWALHLVERALANLREEGSPYVAVLEGQVAGRKQDRNKLWLARRKLTAAIRREVAATCATPTDIEAELRDLAPYLRSRASSEGSERSEGSGGPQITGENPDTEISDKT